MAGSTTNNVERLLADLRDAPIDTSGPSDAVLGQIYTYLMDKPQTSSGEVHWFCSKADPIIVEAATFLLRLFAYDSPQVQTWKQILDRCLSNCTRCIISFEAAKVSSRNTYFGAFHDETLTGFFETFENWELAMVIEKLNVAGFTTQSFNSEIKSISDVSSEILYRMLSNRTIFSDSRILSIIHKYPPNGDVSSAWPSGLVPPGVLLLQISNNPDPQTFTSNYLAALNYFILALNGSPDLSLRLTGDVSELWKGLNSVLKFVPVEIFNSVMQSNGICHIVAKHLPDNGSQFGEVLKCFRYLLKRFGSIFWSQKDVDPQIFFDFIRDNPSLLDLILDDDSPWCISVFMELLHTLKKHDKYEEVFAKTIDFLCGQLQHERFKRARAAGMQSAAHTLISATRKSISSVDQNAVTNVLDRHAEILINQARIAVRISTVIARMRDVLATLAAHTTLEPPPQKKKPLFPIFIRNQMWKNDDSEALSSVIQLVREETFKKLLEESNPGGGYVTGQDAVDDINSALKTVRSGFLAVVSRFVDSNTSSTCLNMLQHPDVAKSVMILLVSPVEELQAGSRALVGMAFDVDARLDFFRALLENVPDAALDGIVQVLTSYLSYATYMPEACSLSQSLVLCLTDIIEVLCSGPNGLLYSAQFLRSSTSNGSAFRLPELWKLMTRSLSVIFKRSANWAVFFENVEMTAWLRDALIFGRDMLAQRRVIETAADSCHVVASGEKPGKLSTVGREMVEHLQGVLYELHSWLRLTDEELLHQSFALLESLLELFRDTRIPPKSETLKKFRKFVNAARDKGKTRLDFSRILRLDSALSPFTARDDNIQQLPELDVSTRTKTDVSKDKSVPISRNHTTNGIVLDQVPGRNIQPISRYSKPTIGNDQRHLDLTVSTLPFRRTAGAKPSATGAEKPKRISPRNESFAQKAIEISSSSDSDSDEEPTEGGLAALTKLEKSVTVKKHEPRRQIKTIDIPVQSNAMRMRIDNREERRRDMARMKPNISGLHRAILSWNYNHDGPMPPDSNIQLFPVPDTLKDYNQYFKVLEPLLLVECWAQLLQAKEERTESYQCKISSRQYSDIWIDLDVSILDSVPRDWYLTETDVILLRHGDNKKWSNADPGLQINSLWRLSKVFSLSTLHREYGALKNQTELQQVMSTYMVNEPQAEAILNSLDTKGFALIQGPPGTVGQFMATRSRPAEPPPIKVLICAPSNAAIDEIASRIKDGIKGSKRTVRVVRIGAEKAMNVSLDSSEKCSKNSNNEISILRGELESVKGLRQQKIDEKNALLDNSAKAAILDIEIKQLSAKRLQLNQQLDRMKDQQKSDSRTMDALRRQTRKTVLQEADVICATLSGAGHEILEDLNFEMIVIDEAAQAIELSSLIPLKYRCARCVMVGDPQQLPPTVISQEASKYRYNQSLFVRLQRQRPDAVQLLRIQYRMHPDISALPSRIFYHGRLLDGPGMEEKTAQPWQHHPKFGTYKFFNVQGVEEPSARSLKNLAECKIAVALYRKLCEEYSSTSLDFSVGIVSMYKAQVIELRRQFITQFGNDIAGRVDFNTVDGFQGQEKGIIILSCVRAGPGLTTVGFLSDVRRMNVALTRAKSSLFILGNAPTLERSDDNWRNIVLDARSRSALVEVNPSYFTTPISYVPPSNPKTKKKAAQKSNTATPTPTDLVIPHEFKTKLNIEAPTSLTSSSETPASEDIKMQSLLEDAPTNATVKQPRGVKRPADMEHSARLAPSLPQVGNGNSVSRPPPAKRPKPKQPTMFIPKKRPKP
ncbi:SEN1 N terminal-domain-containing protein [Cyathus striatus]|nr:SEN1 N terminal-domain-containing protein [Cyathus striatus]